MLATHACRMAINVMHTGDTVERWYTWYIWRALLLGATAATLLGAITLLGWEYAPARRFNEARMQWMEQPIPRYRLVIERPLLNCQQDLEVRHERVVQVFEHTCPIEELTMTDLFNRIDRLDGLNNLGFLNTRTCGCESFINAAVQYDQELGYPTRVALFDRRVVNWRAGACWQHILMHGALPECDVPFLFSEPRVTNISLTPLP